MYYVHSTTEYPAMAAGQQACSRAQSMPAQATRKSSAQTMCGACATASAAASILLLQTDVSASVSLFVLLITLVTLLLVSLISLSGLTGLEINLVGLIQGLSPGTHTGD
jgi:uncharacterized membrane protein YadS